MQPSAVSRARSLLIALTQAALFASSACSDEGPTATNLVLISVDTLRADRLSCLGNPRPTTPEICAFFEKGIVYENAISQSAWTAPAHGSMFTGLYPYKHGVNYGPEVPKITTSTNLFSILKQRGYYLIALHAGGYVRPVLPSDIIDFEETTMLRRDFMTPLRNALKKRSEGQPFFLFLHGTDIHVNYRPKQHYFNAPNPVLRDRANEGFYCSYKELPDGSQVIDPDTIPQGEAFREYWKLLYEGEILEVDRALGGFFRFLDRRHLLENTVVIFTSDHGEELFEHGSCEHVKTVYRELLHVPLMIRLPSGKSLRSGAHVAASIAVAPTALDALGIDPAPFGFDGRSLLKGTPGHAGEIFFAETSFHYDRQRLHRFAAYGSERKLIYDSNSLAFELFDLKRDPAERHDLFGSATAPESVDLEAALRRYVAASQQASGAPGVELDCTTIAELRALGYVSASYEAERCN